MIRGRSDRMRKYVLVIGRLSCSREKDKGEVNISGGKAGDRVQGRPLGGDVCGRGAEGGLTDVVMAVDIMR